MRTFLLWRPKRDGLDPSAVAEALRARFRPLLAEEPGLHRRSSGPVHLAWIELPVRGFRAAFDEREGEAWAFAPDFPLNARRLLRTYDPAAPTERPLLALARQLEARHDAVVRELIPPSSLLWSGAGGVHVANDGLGQSQLFEYEDETVWALSNRVLALPLVGARLEPVPEEWAARMVTNWFPLATTGYRDVRFLPGGTRLFIDAGGVRRARYDCIGEWVHPPASSREDCLERGRQALKDTLADVVELCDAPTLGLSGGWDSRAIAACLRSLGAPFHARVRGQASHFDVIVSAELARVAGIPHRIKSGGGIPPGTPAGCRASISRALLWQGGYFATKKHKNFLARMHVPGLEGGVVNVMGQHAGLGKADFVVKTRALESPREDYQELLVDMLLEEGPGILRPGMRAAARELIGTSYRAAGAYDLHGLDGLLFFYLHEFTRRWGSATVASQTGLVVAPFLCPDMIRACYGLDARDLPGKPIHRHVTANEAPDWRDVPYADQVTEEDFRAGRLPRVEATPEDAPDEAGPLPRWRQVRHHRKYHYKYFWKDVGQPLLDEAFARPGLWSELFDVSGKGTVDLAKKGAADAILVAHLLPEVLADGGASAAHGAGQGDASRVAPPKGSTATR